ncbi:MAG: MBL fold metallo-hydrolase [Fimbriimonas sp.]|nr:MBL fold metallo-hydrolase [Fimbriimonas sp.]
MFVFLTTMLPTQDLPDISLPKSVITQVVFLGTGTPNPDPHHQGPSVAIVVHGQSYIVDCGPGVVRQASAAKAKGADGLDMAHLTKAFITHLHSDHTLGLPDLMLTPAVTGRETGLDIFGPPGLQRMVDHIREAYSEDHEVRFHGGEPAAPEAYKVTVHEVKEGWIYQDDNVRVKAFRVHHGKWKHAFGFRFETPDRVIVLSGDTTYCQEVIDNAKGADILIHEAYSADGLKKRTPDWQAYHSTYHTSGPDVGRIAAAVHPKLVILYHELPFGQPEGEILKEVATAYPGPVVEAKDLDIY